MESISDSPNFSQYGVNEQTFTPEVFAKPEGQSEPSLEETDLAQIGGQVRVAPGIHPELAAAAYNHESALIMHEGQAYLAPFDSIDPDMVELVCIDGGCALVPEDSDPSNDIDP